jgi:hypothetical protein
VFSCTLPLSAAIRIPGFATCNASTATDLLPCAIADSTFLTKVRMRDFRATLRAVRTLVWRMRFRADAVFAMISLLYASVNSEGIEAALSGGGRRGFYRGWQPRSGE